MRYNMFNTLQTLFKLTMLFSVLGFTSNLWAVTKVKIETNQGAIELELYEDKSPVTVKNFVSYVKKGFYEGTIFHRVIPGFMIQGGGLTPDLEKKQTDAPIKNEANNGLSNIKGSIAMARTNVVNSATSQFFINLVDNGNLDHKGEANYGYAVFGKVVKGMDVVEKIGGTSTGMKSGRRDVPKEPIVINKVEVMPY